MEYMRKAILYINWEEYADENNFEEEGEEIEKVKEEIRQIIKKNHDFWELNNNEIIPAEYGTTADVRPQRMIETLFPMIKYLEKNNIPWTGAKLAFMYDEDPGFMIISEDQAIIGYIDEDGDVDKIYIQLPIKKRLE